MTELAQFEVIYQADGDWPRARREYAVDVAEAADRVRSDVRLETNRFVSILSVSPIR